MAINMRDSGYQESSTGMVLCSTMKVINTKDNGNLVRNMDKEHTHGIMETLIMVNLQKGKSKVKVLPHMQMADNMKLNGWMISYYH